MAKRKKKITKHKTRTVKKPKKDSEKTEALAGATPIVIGCTMEGGEPYGAGAKSDSMECSARDKTPEEVRAAKELAALTNKYEALEERCKLLDRQGVLLRRQLGLTRTAFAKVMTEMVLGPCKTKAHREDEEIGGKLTSDPARAWSDIASFSGLFQYAVAHPSDESDKA